VADRAITPVVERGDFVFGVAHLDHFHVVAMTEALVEAGGQVRLVFDPDPERAGEFAARFEGCRPVASLDEILADDDTRLVVAAAVPDERGPLGCRIMAAGKDYFTDKCPFTTLEQLAEARRVAAETGRRYAVYYGERIHNEAAWHAGELIAGGAVGDVVHIAITGPHRLARGRRPDWFFQKARYGGILCDIGSHQCEQFLHYSGAASGTVEYARVANRSHPQHPELEDVGEMLVRMEGGAWGHGRVDWFTPDGLRTWGDGRTHVVGTDGTLEVRKYVDEVITLVDGSGEHTIEVTGRIGYPFFGQLILDCLEGSERAMTQEHVFTAAQLALEAQAFADARSFATRSSDERWAEE
jgi:predicted dehydrogenase